MKGSPRSVWLSWANRAAGAWTGAATAAVRRGQTAMLKAMTTPPKAKPKPAAKRRRKP